MLKGHLPRAITKYTLVYEDNDSVFCLQLIKALRILLGDSMVLLVALAIKVHLFPNSSISSPSIPSARF